MKKLFAYCMKYNTFDALVVWFLLLLCSSLTAQTVTNRTAFISALKAVTTIDFEGIALGPGQEYAVELDGDEFSGVTLIAGPGSDGLFVGIPDASISNDNYENFFANDEFPTSGLAIFSPDKFPGPGSPSPDGILIVNFEDQTNGVGAYFLDAEAFPSYIEAFDGRGGTGNSLGKLIVQNKGDNSQAFAGILAKGIKSAVLAMGGGRDGVAIDDLTYGKNISCGKKDEKILLCHKGKTICVAKSAVKAHIAHGDYYGPCDSSTRKNKCESIAAHKFIHRNRVIIHPNTFRDSFTIEIPQGLPREQLELKVYDIHGNLVKKVNNFTSQKVEVDMSGMNKGLYFYSLRNGKEIFSSGKAIKR